MVSENRYIYSRIDCFLDGHFIASSINRKQCVGIIFGAPSAVYLRYSLEVSQKCLQFSLHIWVFNYTVIANLLHAVWKYEIVQGVFSEAISSVILLVCVEVKCKLSVGICMNW